MCLCKLTLLYREALAERPFAPAPQAIRFHWVISFTSSVVSHVVLYRIMFLCFILSVTMGDVLSSLSLRAYEGGGEGGVAMIVISHVKPIDKGVFSII